MSMVGATRESINKWLSSYEHRGFVQIDGKKLIVCWPKELRQQAY